ncbi:MAG: molybdopterin molybdotransferase MoeA [Deltaproteobacteria bacterium]|nr:molybdopterin molybdotransferase MoeA [Deltaproteobacteria bacterium]
MPGFEEARRIILESVTPLGAEQVPAWEAVGRVLAEDLLAPRDFPAWDNSAMDGYAMRAEDVRPPVRLRLSAYIPAGGDASEPLERGTAAKILTGAPIPAGADAVVPFEEAEERDGAVLLGSPVRAGAHVRRRGEDLRSGAVAVAAGTVLGPAEISFLAASSRLSVPVVRRARVAILSTGDELVAPGEPLAPGKIHDANSLAVAAAVRLAGAEPVLLGIARDDLGSLRELLARGLAADALVTTAGVSMGDRDLVRQVLDELGVRQVFWKVDIKPGRPTAFALRGTTPVFSLPGNPVSTLLTFEQFVRPALLRMMGHGSVLRPLAGAVLQEDVSRRPGRVSFLRVRLERQGDDLLAWSAGDQDTGILRTLLRADGIAILPADWGDVSRGTRVPVQVLRSSAGGAR